MDAVTTVSWNARFFSIPEGQEWDAMEAINVRMCELLLAISAIDGTVIPRGMHT